MNKITTGKTTTSSKKPVDEKLKGIVILALSLFFELSGINEVLIALYLSRGGGHSAKTSQQRKVRNIFEDNPTKKKKTSVRQPSISLNWMLLSGAFDNQAVLLSKVGNNIVTELKSVISLAVDSVASGRSVLDDILSLPLFLTNGLNKIKKQ